MEAAEETPDHRRFTAMDCESEAALGRIAIWAAYVEQNLVDLCAVLINIYSFEVGYSVTATMSASSMINLAKRLLTESPLVSVDDKRYSLAALQGAKAALEQRNKILHATVGGSLEKGKTAFSSSRRKMLPVAAGRFPQLEAAHYGPADLDEIGARLHNAQQDIWECITRVEDAMLNGRI